ncbi:hypothetical protein DFH94DRAFT_782986 [Russula ochroleuca]|uniref:Uncharacterized protein n=1 Tax=Russula ochroleuca TaxID=152965 RepID=A0A9P5JUY3_9AGAM|nr:hypothetical protein DFH94DRAFT_782986 [Russula ochroleuca]
MSATYIWWMVATIDTLATGVPLVNSTKVFGSSGGITFPSEAIPGSNYFIDCKYQNNLSRIPCLFVLCHLTQWKAKMLEAGIPIASRSHFTVP